VNMVLSLMRDSAPPVILSVAKDQWPVFDSSYAGTSVPLTATILNVEDSKLPT
jgi:hypothetical protein